MMRLDTMLTAHQPDENAPERPPSAYVLFSNSEFNLLQDVVVLSLFNTNTYFRNEGGSEEPKSHIH